jgi:hypothetical protein
MALTEPAAGAWFVSTDLNPTQVTLSMSYGRLGTDAGPLATAGSLKFLHDDIRKTVDAGGRRLTRGSPLDSRSLDLSPADLPPPSGSLRAARLEIERLKSARHAVLSQSARQILPHFLACPETFRRTDSKRCRRSREINDFHLPSAQTPRTLFRDHDGISEIRRHLSSFDADV